MPPALLYMLSSLFLTPVKGLVLQFACGELLTKAGPLYYTFLDCPERRCFQLTGSSTSPGIASLSPFPDAACPCKNGCNGIRGGFFTLRACNNVSDRAMGCFILMIVR